MNRRILESRKEKYYTKRESIMAHVSKQDYENFAVEIAKDYIDNGVSLEDGIYKKASDLGLNPFQVKQLTWQTNTRTHLDLFEKKAEDKIIEFPLAEAGNIILRIYGDKDSSESTEKDAELFAEGEELYRDLYTEPLREKEAEVPPAPKVITVKQRGDNILTLRKLASELSSRAMEHAYGYEESIVAIKQDVQKLAQHPDLDTQDWIQLQNDAFNSLGTHAQGIMKDAGLVTDAFIPPLSRDFDDSHSVIQRLKKAEVHYEEAINYTTKLAFLTSKMST